MKTNKNFIILTLTIFALLGLSACGSAESSPEPVEFIVEMSEFAFSPDVIEVQVGQEVTIEVFNSGALEHELMIGQEVMTVNDVPAMYMKDFFDAANADAPEVTGDMADVSHDDDEDSDHDDDEDSNHDDEEDSDHDGGSEHGFMVFLPKGESASFTFVVTEDMVGTWEIGCFLDGGSHYTANMIGTLIVNP